MELNLQVQQISVKVVVTPYRTMDTPLEVMELLDTRELQLHLRELLPSLPVVAVVVSVPIQNQRRPLVV
jgi:hypothetical protein